MGLGLGRLSALLRTGIGGGTGEEEEEVVVLCRFLSSCCCCGFCWEGGGRPSIRIYKSNRRPDPFYSGAY